MQLGNCIGWIYIQNDLVLKYMFFLVNDLFLKVYLLRILVELL